MPMYEEPVVGAFYEDENEIGRASCRERVSNNV
jgi:hypothetical protein